MTQDHALVCPADPHERKAIVRMARDPEWHLDHTSGWCLLHDADHAEHWVRDVTDDYFAMGVRTMTEQQAAAEAAHTADQDLYHDRAEWREVPR